MALAALREQLGKRLALVGVVTAVSMLPGAGAGATTSGTGGCPQGVTDPQYCELIPTWIDAEPVIPSGIFAILHRKDTNAVLPGQTLVFTAGSTPLCAAVTNSKGQAGCTSLSAVLTAVLNLGYKVTYAGTSVYAPSFAYGSAVGLDLTLTGTVKTATTLHATGRHPAKYAWLAKRLRQIGRATLLHELLSLRALHSH